MKFFSINRFDIQVNELTKRNKDGYKDCLKDIASFFIKKTSDEIVQIPVTLEYINENLILKKVRIQNRNQKLSRQDGLH